MVPPGGGWRRRVLPPPPPPPPLTSWLPSTKRKRHLPLTLFALAFGLSMGHFQGNVKHPHRTKSLNLRPPPISPKSNQETGVRETERERERERPDVDGPSMMIFNSSFPASFFPVLSKRVYICLLSPLASDGFGNFIFNRPGQHTCEREGEAKHRIAKMVVSTKLINQRRPSR